MKLVKSFAFVLALSSGFEARAQSFDWGSLLGNLNGTDLGNIGDIGSIGGGQFGDIGSITDLLNGSGDSNAVMSLAFNAAYMYASKDPRYAVILQALNVHSGSDLQNLLMNDDQNFQDIIAHLALAYASENPQFSQWFSQVGVTDQASLVNFMGKSKYKTTVHKMALVQARGDNNYSQWLDQLGIQDVSDIQALLNGEGNGDIFQSLWPLLEQYVQTNYPEYAQFLPLVQQLLGMDSGNDASINLPVEQDDPSIDLPVEDDEIVPPEVLGSFRGLPLSEVKAVQDGKKKTVKKQSILSLLSLFSR
ncbi:MAG: hypothetical protein R3A80_12410 [Bdellovibrionota bacterium]